MTVADLAHEAARRYVDTMPLADMATRSCAPQVRISVTPGCFKVRRSIVPYLSFARPLPGGRGSIPVTELLE